MRSPEWLFGNDKDLQPLWQRDQRGIIGIAWAFSLGTLMLVAYLTR